MKEMKRQKLIMAGLQTESPVIFREEKGELMAEFSLRSRERFLDKNGSPVEHLKICRALARGKLAIRMASDPERKKRVWLFKGEQEYQQTGDGIQPVLLVEEAWSLTQILT